MTSIPRLLAPYFDHHVFMYAIIDVQGEKARAQVHAFEQGNTAPSRPYSIVISIARVAAVPSLTFLAQRGADR